MSATQLGIQRLASNPDTYIPGTLPERLCKRAQLQADNDIDGCYRLTTQDAPITVDEMEAIQAADEHGQAIDRAIETIKKTIRSSRNRVATNRAIKIGNKGPWE